MTAEKAPLPEAVYRAAVESAPNAIVMINRAGEIVLVNALTEKLFGYAREELLGRKVEMLVPQAVRRSHPALRDGYAGSPHPRAMGAGRDLFGVRKDGAEIPVEIGLNPIQTAAGDFVLAAIVDITERKRAEDSFRRKVEDELALKTEALEASEQRYRAMAEAMPIAVFTAAGDGMLDYLNETLINYYGHSAAEMLNADWTQFTHPDDASLLAQAFELSLDSGMPMEVMSRERRHDGEYRWHITRALPVRDHAGKVVKWIGAMLDVEDLQRAKAAAEAAMHAKANFLATMSHEIRTPLNATITMAGLLMDTQLDSQQRDIAETIRSSGEQLLTIINDILDFSKLEAGKLELEKVPFDLRVCIEDALDLVGTQAAGKNLELAYEIAPPTPYALVGNPDRLRQILVNLLSNAVKFTERGEVVVKVSSRPLSGALHEIEIAVRDTGIGIAPHEIPRLFQAFSQADASTTRRFGGTGLGLAICRRLIEAMGGQIWVKSKPGEGSCFSFTVQTEIAAQRSSDAIWIGGKTGLAGLRVLIVDDNATNRRILLAHAKAWGMQAADFESGRAALEHLRTAAPYRIAVLDYMMPEMDGLSLARELRARFNAQQLAIVILSSANIDAAQLAQAGGDIHGVFVKPIRQSVLYSALIEALNGQRVRHERRRIRGRAPLMKKSAAAAPAGNHSLRVLVAEDNPVNQKVKRMLLAKLGYRADFVSNGQEAVAAVVEREYDVVLMDVMMPDMDGFRATQEIRARIPPARQPRIIAVTALALEGDRDRCLAAGMDDYISKPIQPQLLAEVLARNSPTKARSDAAPLTAGGKAAVGRASDLDVPTLDKLKGEFGEAEARGLIEELVGDAERLLQGFAAAVANADAANLKLFAHSLKSMSKLVGATALAAEFEALEALAATGRTDGAADKAEPAGQRYRALMNELTAHTAAAPALRKTC